MHYPQVPLPISEDKDERSRRVSHNFVVGAHRKMVSGQSTARNGKIISDQQRGGQHPTTESQIARTTPRAADQQLAVMTPQHLRPI